MQRFFVTVVLLAFAVGGFARSVANLSSINAESPVAVFPVDDGDHIVRQKRQFDFGPQFFGQSSALANANAFNQYGGLGGFGGSAANAAAQSFQSQGPFGGFGASASNSMTQGFHVGPNGIQGSAGFSGSQTYDLPNGRKIIDNSSVW